MKLKRHQTSVWIPQEYRVRDEKASHLRMHPHMLFEDIRNFILPYRRDRPDENEMLTVEPDLEEAQELASNAISMYRSHSSLSMSFREFAGAITQELMLHKTVTAEVALGLDDSGTPKEFYLVLLDPEYLERDNMGVWQRIPAKLAKERELSERIALPSDRLVTFRRPSEYAAAFEAMYHTLASVSDFSSGLFAMDHFDRSQDSGYNFKEHERSRQLSLAECTRQIGWNSRGLINDQTTEYYQIARRLRFELFLIVMRDQILDSINQGFQIGGTLVKHPVALAVNGLPTREDVKRSRDKLLKGGGSFAEVMRPFHDV